MLQVTRLLWDNGGVTTKQFERHALRITTMSVEQSPTPIAAPDTAGKSAQDKQRTRSKDDKYAGVPNLKSPQQVPLQDLIKDLTLTDLIGSRVIEGPYLALRAPYDVVQDGVSWGC